MVEEILAENIQNLLMILKFIIDLNCIYYVLIFRS